jgi:hypothetical protein
MSIEDVEVTIRYFHLFLHFQSRFIFRFFLNETVQAMLLGRAAIARARGAMVRHCG